MPTKQLPKWVRYRAAAYLRGKGLSLGVPSLIDGPLFPLLAHEGKTFEINAGTEAQRHVVGNDLSIFSNNSFDHVVTLATHPQINELATKLVEGGHLVTIGGDVVTVTGSWRLKERSTEDGLTVRVYKKLAGRNNLVEDIKTVVTKRVCIVRYGAIGDALQLTPLIHQLHDDGYEVTLNISPYTIDIYRNNPFVSNIIIQERSVVPNQDLGPYWDYWCGQYDRYINLSESIEGKLLKVEGRDEFYTAQKWRHRTCNVNYHDQHMRLGGYTDTKYHLPELYFTRTEEKEIGHELRLLADNFVIAWGLKGSSHHKVYPYYPEVASEWLDTHPDSYILQIGGPDSTVLEIDHQRAVPLSGKWSLRKSLLCTKYVDVVIGPESALINAASCFTTPKICLMSHSTPYNLTHYWKNVTALMPDTEMAPCYPCHQLHYNLDSCPTVNIEIGDRQVKNLPACVAAIRPEIVFDALEDAYQSWRERRLIPPS